jgi:serine/threonine protein phosphatase PrpC
VSRIEVRISEQASSDSRNEDRVVSYPQEGILVVADGFGGGDAGKAAVKTACEAVREFIVHEGGDRDATLPFVLRSYFSLAGNVLFNAMIHANRKLLAMNTGKSVHEKGGASVVAAYLDNNTLSLASVGACSAWICREGRFSSLVTPRSWGRMTQPTDPGNLPAARLPLMALGISSDLEPEVVEVRIQPGDWIWVGTFEPPLQYLQTGVSESDVKSISYATERSELRWHF